MNNDSGPTTTIVTTADSGIDDRTVNTYDGAGRMTLTTEFRGTTATWATRTIYGGDRSTVVPSAVGASTGRVESTTLSDVRGKTTELDQWTTPPTINANNTLSGGHDQITTYHYTPLGLQDQMVTGATDSSTALTATWNTSFDLDGRAYSQADPDTGTTTTTFDDIGEVLSTTGPTGTLTYAYDALGRKTAEYAGTGTTNQIGGWVYDTLQAGQLTSSTRYTSNGNYTVAVTGY